MLWFLSLALAGPQTAQEWLQAADNTATVSDAHAVLQVTPRGRENNQRTVEIWQKGADRRLARLTEPAMLRGVSLLSNPDGLWVYLPVAGKPKSVIGKAKDDRFMGSDFTFDDLSRTVWSGDWVPSLDNDPACAEVPTATCLLLTPVDPSAQTATAVRLWVDQASQITVRADRLDMDGTPFRRTVWSDIREVDGVSYAHRLEVYDLQRDKSSVAVISDVSIGTGMDASMFEPDKLGKK